MPDSPNSPLEASITVSQSVSHKQPALGLFVALYHLGASKPCIIVYLRVSLAFQV